MASVLIVEDNVSLGRLYGNFLTIAGYAVKHASKCADALKQLENDRPDIVVLDVGLPDGNGMTIAERIREDARFEDTEIIVVSGNEQPVQDLERLGINRFLAKPVSLPILGAAVKRSVV